MRIRAKYLWRGDGAILENGLLETRGRRIVSVRRIGSRPPPMGVRDLGDAVILPGLVNAHAHLELSALRGRVRSGRHFHLWLERVRSLRSGMSRRDLLRSSREGVEESLRSGTTTVVDHSYTAASLPSLRDSGIRAHLVFEMIALRESRIPGFESAYRKLRRAARRHPRVRIGVAPHAPYTASADLYRAARAWIGPEEILSTHLAEHRAERELLMRGTGHLRWLLEKREMGIERWRPPRLSPYRHLQSLGVLRPGTLLVHCNYAGRKDIEILRREKMPVVYCPRSHAFFGHPRHPVGRFREAGIPVALGTDSLTSNRTLSILDEMRFLAGRRHDLSPRTLLEMATRDGARALGASRRMGRLARGYLADVVAIALPGGGDGSDPEERLLSAGSRVILTVVDGFRRFDGVE